MSTGTVTYRSGHRERLRKRFLEGGERGLSERELLELLLTYAIPRKDTKPLAAALLREFGSLAGVLRQPPSMLGRVEGIGPAAAALVSLVMRLATRSMEPSEGEKLDCPDSVREYLRHRMGTLRRERFHALFLDSGNRLLASEDLEFGTVDRASVHPRNLVEKVLSSNATAVILVHNHPGGRLEASREDVQLTKRLSGLAESLGFTILDHLIVTDRDILSLREEGLLDFT